MTDTQPTLSSPARWKGLLYADLRNTDLSVWRAWLDYPIAINSGRGSVRAWLTLASRSSKSASSRTARS